MQRIAHSAAVLLIGSVALAESDTKKSESQDHPKHAFAFRVDGTRLGVEALPISKEVRQMLGAPDDAGVLVNRVEPDTAAAEAGIKAGDVIVEIDGHKVASVGDIRETLADKHEGDKSQVMVIREKSRKTLTASIKKSAWYQNFGRAFAFDDGFPGADAFSPRVHQQLERLSERIAELEKKLQKLDSK